MSKCAHKLAPRWGALITFIYLGVMGLVRWGYGTMPATNVVQWAFDSGSIELPFSLPRLVDAVPVFLVSTILAWLFIDIYVEDGAPYKMFGFSKEYEFLDALSWCSALGVVGAGFAIWGGLSWTLAGAVITAVITSSLYLQNVWRKTYKARWKKDLSRKLAMAHWWGGLIMFILLSLFTSMLPAAAYTLFTLAVLISLELVVAVLVGGGILAVRVFRVPFKRTFLMCDLDGSCGEAVDQV